MNEKIAVGKDWRVILSLVVSALGTLFFFGQAFLLGAVWLMLMIVSGGFFEQIIPIGLLMWSSILSGLLLIPVALLNFYNLQGRAVPKWLDTSSPRFRKIALWVILIWPVVVLVGWLVAGSPPAAVFLLGPINVLAAGLPVLWLITAAQLGLKSGSHKRKWQIFGFSLTLSPVLIMLVELVALVGLVLIWVLVMGFRTAGDSHLQRDLMYIASRLSMAGDDLDLALKLLQPILLQPTVIYWTLVIMGGVMPIIEELLKPLALWFLADKKISPQEGFVSGLICGAGFALMENLLYFTSAILAEDWLFMAISRSGTGVLHMLTTGLVGWGLAKTWRDSKWPFLALTTLGAFLLHGVWNVLAVAAGIAPLFVFGIDSTFWQQFLFYVPLIILLLFSIAGLVGINRILKKNQAQLDDNLAEAYPSDFGVAPQEFKSVEDV